MWPTDSSGLPQAYDYGDSIVSFPGMASILASIRSLLFFSALLQPSGKKCRQRGYGPPSHQRAFGKMFLEVYFFFLFLQEQLQLSQCCYFQSYNEKGPFGVYILFGFRKKSDSQCSTEFPSPHSHYPSSLSASLFIANIAYFIHITVY